MCISCPFPLATLLKKEKYYLVLDSPNRRPHRLICIEEYKRILLVALRLSLSLLTRRFSSGTRSLGFWLRFCLAVIWIKRTSDLWLMKFVLSESFVDLTKDRLVRFNFICILQTTNSNE
jgi:hypothetical protein